MGCKLIGDWNKLGIVLQRLSATLFPLAKIRLEEDANMILEKLKSHIDNQDLNWEELSPITVERKGSSQIYYETGNLYDNLVVKKVGTSPRGTSLFIGPDPNATHTPSGLNMNELMLYLEYGTDKLPPRPLIRPTWEEVEPLVKDNFEKILEQIVKG